MKLRASERIWSPDGTPELAVMLLQNHRPPKNLLSFLRQRERLLVRAALEADPEELREAQQWLEDLPQVRAMNLEIPLLPHLTTRPEELRDWVRSFLNWETPSQDHSLQQWRDRASQHLQNPVKLSASDRKSLRNEIGQTSLLNLLAASL